MSVRLLLVLLFCVWMSCGADSAHAGKGVDAANAARARAGMGGAAVEQRARAFLLAKDIHQWLDFNYEYNYSASDSNWTDEGLSSHRALLEHTYHFDTLYAILRPKLLMGTLQVDIGFDGEWQKSEAQGADTGVNPTLQYRLDGIFFKDEKYPVDFESFYTKDMIDRVFARDYDMDIRGESVGFFYKNGLLPTKVSYSQSEGTTSGLTDDRTSTSRNIALNSTHLYKEFSSTNFSMMGGQFDSQSETREGQDMATEMVSALVDNTLYFNKKNLARNLVSQYTYTDSRSDSENQGTMSEDWSKSSVWVERLYWQMGRALFTGLDYRNTFFELPASQQNVQAANGWFRHQLFDNFTTNFRIGDRESQFLQGTESDVSGNLGFNYTRHLPRESYLSMGLDNSYGVSDRNLESGLMPVVDKPFFYDATRFNYLEEYDIEIETIVVRNKERTQVYEEGIDYTVEAVGRQTRIEIPRGSAISPGDTLSLDYEYMTNPDIKYASKANTVYSTVDLFDHSYRVGVQASQGSQDLLEGDDTNVSMVDYTEYKVNLEKSINFFTFKGEYADLVSTTESNHSWGASVEYRRYWNQYHLSANLRGRQIQYDAVTYREIASEAGTENSISAQVNLRKRLLLLPGAMWETKAWYLQLEGRGNESSEVNINTAFQVFLGKSQIRLEAEVSQLDENGRQSQEALVLLQFRRFF